jgi:type IV pilus assembly protein PilB
MSSSNSKGQINGSAKSIESVATTLVDRFINLAVEKGASDIHIQPESDHVTVRLRVDGILREVEKIPKDILDKVVARVKVLSNLNISEIHHPQDGRFQLSQLSKLDFRVSIFPTIHGESVVIRLLDQAKLVSFADLGLEGKLIESFKKIINKPYGLILATGPTGSGKTTTLFSILNKLNSPEKCIVTLEDPVEFHLDYVRQTQIDIKRDFDFAQGLRSLFRQNPNIIMVGEIRDKLTAEIAIQAAITGHLVLSTLHTNDSVGALIRLREMGLEKFLITSATAGIIAQRLVRRICPKCREEYTPPKEMISALGLEGVKDIKYYQGKGCLNCQNTGYQGLTGIFEVLMPTIEINELVYKDAGWQKLFEAAQRQGMQTLQQSGLIKVKEGITTLDEIIRATY